jgi:hypothetical protein
MHGGDTHLADKLRRLLAFLAIGLVVAVIAEFAISLIQAGRSWWSLAGTDSLILQIATALLAIACVLLFVGSLAMLGRRTCARPVLLGGSAIWLVAIVGLIAVQTSGALRGAQPRAATSWLVVMRQAENWIIMGGALPLLLFAFAGWRELIPQQRVTADESPDDNTGPERSSFATRLMRVLSVYGVAFGGTSLAILVYLAATNGRSLPDLRFPYSFSHAFQQFAAVLDWTTSVALVAGAIGEILSRTWGRRLMLIGAAAWIAGASSSLMWGVLISGGSITAQLPLYALFLLGRLERSVYPVMLLVCLRWPEVRSATTSAASAGFQPIMPLAPAAEESPR